MIRPKATTVVPQSDYCLLVTFNNDEKRIFDVKPYLQFKPFNELKNLTIFNTVKPAGLSIEWIHGQDICPDELYYNSVPTGYSLSEFNANLTNEEKAIIQSGREEYKKGNFVSLDSI